MIETTREGPLALVTLHRPDARNALSIAGWESLAAAVREIAASDARVVLLRSAVPLVFTAGADLGEFELLRQRPIVRTRFRIAMRDAIDGLAALPIPVIAAIDGGCYGAGVALALACDLRVAGAGAQFAVTPAKLGLGYPREDVARLVAQVGKGQAARLLYSAEILEAPEATAIGLAEIATEEAEPLARVFADRIAANAPVAIRLLKRTLADPDDEALDDAFEARFGSDEFAEGLDSFRNRRRPRFA